jgi:hypothetical protein
MANVKKTVKALVKKGDAALASKTRRAEALIALIARRKARIVEDFFDIGEALREILRKELYRALGHKSFDELLKARGLMGAEQARKLIAIVDRIPRDQAIGLGQEKAYALVAYTVATPEVDMPAEFVEGVAKIGGIALSKLSVREIDRATREVRAKTKAAKPKTEKEKARGAADREVESAIRKWLRASGFARVELRIEGNSVHVIIPRSAALRFAAG